MSMFYPSSQLPQSKIRWIVGDVGNMNQFSDQEFDVVFSSSFIERLRSYDEQVQMAHEIIRVGQRYFIQTQNPDFSTKSHFAFPIFQFLPVEFRMWGLRHFDLSWNKKVIDSDVTLEMFPGIRFLSKTEFVNLFPNSSLYEEKLLGMTKSFVAYGGWHN
jgi:Methyltransferase domain